MAPSAWAIAGYREAAFAATELGQTADALDFDARAITRKVTQHRRDVHDRHGAPRPSSRG